ncbi:hypothetical protein G9A89_014889 [Geosiphon pyriformis]|nr:hypothetical protein G9A89_014889 [Geosiphon pyriformis]
MLGLMTTKHQGKWNNKPCLACGEQLFDKKMWNDISSQGGTCNALCQYMILISNWVSCDMPITAAWHKDEIWQMANTKVQGATPSKILEIKNNLSEQVDIIFVLNPNAFLDIKTNPKDFHEHYQNLALLPDKIRDIASTTFKKRDQKPPITFGALLRKQHSKNKFKVATTLDATTLEYYQSIYTHCKQRFNIPDGIEVVKKSVYQYIENRINNYLFGNYNISEVRSNLYNNLAHYSQLGAEDLNSETLATYFQELNFNIIKYCEETYPVQSQYSIDFELETKTSNKGKHKLKQYSKTTPNTPILPKTTAKHLQTPEQGTNSENKEDEMTAYIAKIPEFNRENIKTSPQEWLDQVTKAGDANRWNAARMLRTIPYFLKETAGKWFENLATSFNDWDAFKAAFLEQFTDNNTSITLRNWFHNIKQEFSESDKLIKKICPHAPEDLNSVIQHAKRYEMAIEEANHTKLVNLAIGETSSAAEEKIDQLAKKVENYFTNQQQQQPQRYQPPQRRNQNNFISSSNNQSQNCHYCEIPGHWKRDCRKLQ